MDKLNILFYDIECLPELFSVATYYEINGQTYAVIYYLLPDREKMTPNQEKETIQETLEKNPNIDRNAIISIKDLYTKDNVLYLASTFDMVAQGLSIQRPILKDTDPRYDESRYFYIGGYNIVNYDMTMLAYFFMECFTQSNPGGFMPPEPAVMRAYNDELFDKEFKPRMYSRLQWRYIYDPKEIQKNKGNIITINGRNLIKVPWGASTTEKQIYDHMISTGRHLDIARLNEKQARVGLKRILGMLGYQILEPEISLNAQAHNKGKMSFRTLKNTLAYNVSDVAQLSHLMEHDAYRGPFLLKKQMLKDYPGAIYEKKPDKYEPNIGPEFVKRNRLTINASSAQLAAAALCPYGSLSDIPVVNFDYPHPKKAKEQGIDIFNVLEKVRTFIDTRMKPLVKSEAGQSIIDGLQKMLNMYGNIAGKDFNASHAEEGYDEIFDIRYFKDTVNVVYMGPDGEPTSCFATFSIGGIHGAEYNKALYDRDMAEYHQNKALFEKIMQIYPQPATLACEQDEKGKLKKRKTFVIDGREYQVKDFLSSGYTMNRASWKKSWLELQPPELFPAGRNPKTKEDGTRKLAARYGWTSTGEANHEDFTSYYPRLLSRLMAFYNALMGNDPYEEIFQQKTRLGNKMDDPKYDKPQQALFKNMRNGTKLILNSASGAADTEYTTSIRMNNQITKMRIIGQMFSWMIAQAQALEGARIPSTNTDGIYTFFEEKKNNEILFREAAVTGVEIEPERMWLISKDTNNRIEFKLTGKTGSLFEMVKILNTSGGNLACYDGPDPEKSLDHPAIQDWALTWFLIYKTLYVGKINDFEPGMGMWLIKDMAKTQTFMKKIKNFSEKRRYLVMFQHIIASSPGKSCYTFASKTPITDPRDQSIQTIPCQHYTRIFYINPEKMPDEQKDRIVYLSYAYMMKKHTNKDRSQDNSENETNNDPSYPAIIVIRDYNGDTEALSDPEKVPKIKKIKGLEPTQPCIIVNEDLDYCDFDPEWLDFAYYNKMLETCYNNSWKNHEV